MSNLYSVHHFVKNVEALRIYLDKINTTAIYNDFESIDLNTLRNNKEITIKSYVSRVKPHKTKTKETMAFLSLDTGGGEIEVVAFVQTYTAYKKQIKKGNIIDAVIKKTNKGFVLMRVED